MVSNPKIQLLLVQMNPMQYQLTSCLSHFIKSFYIGMFVNHKKKSGLRDWLKHPIDKKLSRKFHQYKQELLHSKALIEVTDFGAGSRVFTSNERPVKKIARIAGMTDRKSKNLIRICQYFQPKNILEIGTSLGLGTYSLYLGAPKANITTIEGCPNTAQVAKTQLKKFGAAPKLIIGPFDQDLKPLLQKNEFNLIYFDGNHSKTATLNYFAWAADCVTSPSIFIFDDIHWSKEMHEAWKKIQTHPKVREVHTTYQWGILLF